MQILRLLSFKILVVVAASGCGSVSKHSPNSDLAVDRGPEDRGALQDTLTPEMGASDSSPRDTLSIDPFSTTRALIEKLMVDARFPGLSIAVVRESDLIWSAAFGYRDVDAQFPVTVDTPFQLASVSKTVIGVAIMRSIEQGKLELDREINSDLPFTVDNPRVSDESIRLSDLVTHTSGIWDNWDTLNNLYVSGDSKIALGDFLAGYLVSGGIYYNAGKNFFPIMPGTAWNYSNVGSTLAAYLIESTSGIPFDQFCNAQIFTPLGMSRTGWHLSDFTDPTIIALPYSDDGTHYKSYGYYGYPDYPDGALRTSVVDFSRFLRAVMNGGAINGTKILSSQSVDMMLSQQIPGIKDTQGIFWIKKLSIS